MSDDRELIRHADAAAKRRAEHDGSDVVVVRDDAVDARVDPLRDSHGGIPFIDRRLRDEAVAESAPSGCGWPVRDAARPGR